MIDYLEAYKQYYFVRMKRYEGNTDYNNTFAAEKALFDIINSCKTLEEFKSKMGNANEQIAIALVTDQQQIRLGHYNEINEVIKAESCRRIIEKAKQLNNSTDLISMVNEEQNAVNIAIATDTISPFDDTGYLENIEICEQAKVPDTYRERFSAYAREQKTKLKNGYSDIENEMNKWKPGWQFDFEKINEERHRRLLPYPDEVILEQKRLTQQILNR
ncbi:MAG: hypothetical protein WAU23_12905 [Ferruginibacter sp.]